MQATTERTRPKAEPQQTGPQQTGLLPRLARFLRKPPRDRMRALRATALHLLRPDLRPDLGPDLGPADPARTQALLRGALGPRGFGTASALYLAYRPDSDAASQHPELAGLLGPWLHDNFANNAGDLVRFYALAFNLKHLIAEGVPGDCAELGVFRGNSASLIAHYARLAGRTTYLFDTFAGFARDDLAPSDLAAAADFDDTSQERVARLVGTEGVVFCQGRFPASIPPGLHERRFCLVHIDCDLYAPARAALEFFYPRLHPGGMLILHDYASPHWQGIRQAADEFLAGRPERLVLLADKSGSAVLRKTALPTA
jgi:hypothetical protein